MYFQYFQIFMPKDQMTRGILFLTCLSVININIHYNVFEIWPAGTMTYRNINPISIDILILNFWLEGSFVYYFQKFVILKQKTNFLPNFEAF